MKLRLLAFLLLGLISSKGYSQDGFIYSTSSTDGTDFYYKIKDTTDFFNSISSVELWLRYNTPSKRVKNKKGKYITTGGEKILRLLTIYCSSQTYDVKSTIKYNSRGQVIYSDDFPEHSQNIVPGSVMEGVYKDVCQK